MKKDLNNYLEDISEQDYDILYDIYNYHKFTEEEFREMYLKNLKKIPNYLFRYQKIDEDSLEKLKNSVVRCSNPSYFQDGFDTGIRYENIEKAIKSKGYKVAPPPPKLENLLKNERENTRVACFTDIHPKDGEYLWENFADNFQGFCIEYDILSLYEKDSHDQKIRYLINKVIYTRELEKFYLFFVQEIEQSAYSMEIFKKKFNIPAQCIRIKSLLKDSKYERESEWRLVYWILDDKGLEWPHRPKNDFLPIKIKAIHLGKKISVKNKKKILDIINNIPAIERPEVCEY